MLKLFIAAIFVLRMSSCGKVKNIPTMQACNMHIFKRSLTDKKHQVDRSKGSNMKPYMKKITFLR